SVPSVGIVLFPDAARLFVLVTQTVQHAIEHSDLAIACVFLARDQGDDNCFELLFGHAAIVPYRKPEPQGSHQWPTSPNDTAPPRLSRCRPTSSSRQDANPTTRLIRPRMSSGKTSCSRKTATSSNTTAPRRSRWRTTGVAACCCTSTRCHPISAPTA